MPILSASYQAHGEITTKSSGMVVGSGSYVRVVGSAQGGGRCRVRGRGPQVMGFPFLSDEIAF
jgi:Uri superfamily endonuclease